MSALSSKLRKLEHGRVAFWCPGCISYHQVIVEGDPNKEPVWGYNNNPDAPTFNPSVLVRGTKELTQEECDRIIQGETITPIATVCHSYVRDGQIQFLDDSTHFMSGTTVDLPDLPDSEI